jgi:hypothetical protein
MPSKPSALRWRARSRKWRCRVMSARCGRAARRRRPLSPYGPRRSCCRRKRRSGAGQRANTAADPCPPVDLGPWRAHVGSEPARFTKTDSSMMASSGYVCVTHSDAGRATRRRLFRPGTRSHFDSSPNSTRAPPTTRTYRPRPGATTVAVGTSSTSAWAAAFALGRVFRRRGGADVPRRARFICQAWRERPSTPCARAQSPTLRPLRADPKTC